MPDPLTEIEAERQRCYRDDTPAAARLLKWLEVTEGLYLLLSDIYDAAPGVTADLIEKRMMEMEL